MRELHHLAAYYQLTITGIALRRTKIALRLECSRATSMAVARFLGRPGDLNRQTQTHAYRVSEYRWASSG